MPRYPSGGGVTQHTALTDKEVAGVIDHALLSVRDGHTYNYKAWKRLLATQPHRAIDICSAVWLGGVNEDNCAGMTFDGTYLYFGLTANDPNVLVKMNPSTLAIVGTWSAPAGVLPIVDIVFDGTYIYVGIATPSSFVYKVDPETMTTVDTWTGAAGEVGLTALGSDGTYIYVSVVPGGAINTKLVQVDPSTMTTNATWDSGGLDGVGGTTFDGLYIYVAIGTSPAKVHKIDPAAMAIINTWTGGAGENSGFRLAFDGTYIYVSLYTPVPGIVIKIKPDTMTTVATWTGAAGQNSPVILIFDGEFIYLALDLSPVQVVKIDTLTMATISTWTGALFQDFCNNALTFDGKYIYIGTNTSPARVIRKIMRNIDETGT